MVERPRGLPPHVHPRGINRNILEPTGAPDGSVNEGILGGVDQELVSATMNLNLARACSRRSPPRA